jgi:hypothetical protein
MLNCVNFKPMRKSFLVAFSFLIVFSFLSQAQQKKKSKRKTTKSKKEIVQPIIPASKPFLLCYSAIDWPSWYLTSIVGFQFPTNSVKPANYRLLKIDEPSMLNYFKKIPYTNSKFSITVPLFIEGTTQCKDFMVERVSNMDSTLQAKYPELMSFRAYEVNNPLNSGSINCDAKSTKYMFTYNTQVYYVTPLNYNGEHLYVAYSKNDPNFQKKAFEQKR